MTCKLLIYFASLDNTLKCMHSRIMLMPTKLPHWILYILAIQFTFWSRPQRTFRITSTTGWQTALLTETLLTKLAIALIWLMFVLFSFLNVLIFSIFLNANFAKGLILKYKCSKTPLFSRLKLMQQSSPTFQSFQNFTTSSKDQKFSRFPKFSKLFQFSKMSTSFQF